MENCAGKIVVKVLPENLDRFLQKIREPGELKNQTLGTEDVTKGIFRYRCAAEERPRNGAASDRHAENEDRQGFRFASGGEGTGPVREEIEKMQGELKYLGFAGAIRHGDHFAGGKDMEEPAAFPAQGTRPAGTLRARCGEDLQRDQRPRLAKGADHKCATQPRLLRTCFSASEHVDRSGRKRCV